MTTAQLQFTIQKIVCPRIDFTLIKNPTMDKFNQGFRVSVLLISSSTMRVLFGLRMTSQELVADDSPAASITTESIADVQFSQDIGDPKKVSEIPMIENILAVIYPFLREKVAYCFGNNEINLMLPPMNTYDLLAKFGDSAQFEILDVRSATSLGNKPAARV